MQQKVSYFQRSVRKDRTAIAFLTSRHAPRTLERRSELDWYRAAYRWHTSLLRRYSAKLAPAWPPHHSMWLCFHSIEAPGAGWRANTGNGYYGGLQMHEGWGYGTSYHASDDSQLVQEWAAEHAYKASGYASSFLWQQWAADARCF